LSYGRREDDEYGTLGTVSDASWHEHQWVRAIAIAAGTVIGLWSLVIVLAVVTVLFS